MQKIILKSFFTLLLIGVFIPRLTIGGTWIGVDDIIALISIPLLGGLFFYNVSRNKLISIAIMPLCVFVLFFLFYGMLQSYSYLGTVRLPSELWQYIKRIVCFLIALNLFHHMADRERVRAINFFLLVILTCLMIGLLQFLGVEFLTTLYGRTDAQINSGLYTNHQQRVYSVAGFSTAWGGLATFMFFATIGLASLKKIYGGISRFYVLIIFLIYILAIFNVFSSGSRGAWISFGFCLCLLYFLMFVPLGLKNFKIIPLAIFLLLLLFFIVNTYFYERLEFMLFRFEVFGETAGGGRGEQVSAGIDLLNTWYEWLAGVSNVTQRTFGQSFGIESEPFNILVNYGVIGFTLVYLTIFNLIFILRKLYNLDDCCLYTKLVYVSSFSAILSYMLFSIGYFYFAELIVGTFSWLIFGAFIGVGLYKHTQQKDM